jgi:hypothetical protein
MQTSSFFVDVRAGEQLKVSGPATIELFKKSGQLVRLRITAALDVVASKAPANTQQSRDKHGLVEPG